MTEKKLKKLNRYQLLELLIAQTERADQLQKKVDELEERLQEHELNYSKLGSLTEAAAQISGLFEASQQTAELYLDSAVKQANTILITANKKANSILNQAMETARHITGGHEIAGKWNADEV